MCELTYSKSKLKLKKKKVITKLYMVRKKYNFNDYILNSVYQPDYMVRIHLFSLIKYICDVGPSLDAYIVTTRSRDVTTRYININI